MPRAPGSASRAASRTPGDAGLTPPGRGDTGAQVSCMDMILFLQPLEPRAVVRLVFAGISWCGDGPLYFLLFPLLYWGKTPAVAVRYGYVWGWAVLVLSA